MLVPQPARARMRAQVGYRSVVSPRVVETPLAHKLTLASMFVYLAKVANLPDLGHFELGKVFVGLALLALLFEGGGWKEGIFSHRVMQPYLLMFFIALITIPFGIWPGGSVRFLFGNYFKDLVLVVLLIVTTRTMKDVRGVLWIVIINTLVLDAIMLHYGIHKVTTVHLGKNGIAMTSVIAFGLLLGLGTRGIGSLFKWMAGAMLIYAIFMSVSRGSYIGLSLVLTLFMYFRFGNRALLALLGLVVFVAGIYAFGPPRVHRTINTLVHIQRDYNLTARTGRIAIWRRGLRIVEQHPFGVGIGNFPIAEGHLVEEVIGERWMNASNALLQATAELGIIGGIVFLVLLKRAMETANNLRRNQQFTDVARVGVSVVLALFGYFITALFLSKAYTVILYILIAIVISADRIYTSMRERKENVVSR
ncbi:MAG: O-antigen ligase family protein [Acidiferrobacter sp.]